MEGKTCVITGGNAGIGFETAKVLATKGAEVLLISRNKEKAESACQAIREQTQNQHISYLIADLGIQEEIRKVAAKIKSTHNKIDVLVNNAGTWMSKQTFTNDGIETVFAVNHLAYVLLTAELYPLLRNTSEARIINVSSDSHFNARLDFDNLYLHGRYNGLRSYALSKLGNVLFTYELHRRKKENYINVNAVQPGKVITDIGLKHTLWWHGLIWKLRRAGGKTPLEGAATSIYLASSNEASGMSGKYWDNCAPKPSSKLSYDKKVASRLWEVSLDLLNMKDFL